MHLSPLLRRFLFVTVFVLALFSSLAGQTKSNSTNSGQTNKDDPPPPPSEEKFQPASGLVAPWRDSGCHLSTDPRKPGCYQVSVEEYEKASNLTIYDSDGALWHKLDIGRFIPQYNLANKEKGFLPFSVSLREPSQSVILRMVAESENWYEVEINETTRQTRYILKSDLLWSRTSWEHWLSDRHLYPGKDNATLLEKPDGKPVPEIASIKFQFVDF